MTSRGARILTAATALAAIAIAANFAGAAGFRKDSEILCVTAAEAARQPNKDICVSAHVYDVVQLPDGSQLLDICAPDVPDDQCKFLLVSLREDREDVGELSRYRNQNLKVRGIVRSMHGRMGIVLSHLRQFSGGAEKFKPNPKLLHGFNGQTDQMPVRDPNLRASGRHRSFTDAREKETIPATPSQ